MTLWHRLIGSVDFSQAAYAKLHEEHRESNDKLNRLATKLGSSIGRSKKYYDLRLDCQEVREYCFPDAESSADRCLSRAPSSYTLMPAWKSGYDVLQQVERVVAAMVLRFLSS